MACFTLRSFFFLALKLTYLRKSEADFFLVCLDRPKTGHHILVKEVFTASTA